MKMLFGLASLALSAGVFASTIDTKTFVYDGSVNSVELLLRAEKTHTEYRTENRTTTCYRQEVVGYRTVCTGGGYGPYPRPRPYPGPGPVRQCWTEPMYRTVAYSCVQPVTISYEVKDFDVEARAIVDVTKISPEATPGETFKVTLNGDSLSFEAIGSKKFFIVKTKQAVRSSMMGGVKEIDALLAAELIEAAPVLKAIKMNDISIANGVLNFNMGPTSSNLGYALKIEKVKFLGSDTTLLDRELLSSEVEVRATSEGSEAGVNVAKLGVELSGGKFRITAKAFAKFNGNLMNSTQYDELSASRTLIYKN